MPTGCPLCGEPMHASAVICHRHPIKEPPRADLPAAVVERCTDAANEAPTPGDWTTRGQTRAALAEFLAIIEERAGPGWMVATGFDRSLVLPLAELLEDLDAD